MEARSGDLTATSSVWESRTCPRAVVSACPAGGRSRGVSGFSGSARPAARGWQAPGLGPSAAPSVVVSH